MLNLCELFSNCFRNWFHLSFLVEYLLKHFFLVHCMLCNISLEYIVYYGHSVNNSFIGLIWISCTTFNLDILHYIYLDILHYIYLDILHYINLDILHYIYFISWVEIWHLFLSRSSNDILADNFRIGNPEYRSLNLNIHCGHF